ncbi:hypothetical protein [Hymenobacter sp. UYP22]|uniref:hypothetical protein n=1 Tax=Hymenobacter sp. UYP22 TaxID=3156348 RepID=UPI00339A9627
MAREETAGLSEAAVFQNQEVDKDTDLLLAWQNTIIPLNIVLSGLFYSRQDAPLQ